MASKRALRYLRQVNGIFAQNAVTPSTCSPIRASTRSMATTSDIPVSSQTISASPSTESSRPSASDTGLTSIVRIPTATYEVPADSVATTIYSFPEMEPLRYAYYPQNHLYLPLRRDILHRAVVFEGDKTRQGTASTKWRDDVHGTHKKHHPQKGLGMARAGDKQSPIFRGGGVVFGPHPRDFSTKLNKKVYDLAWRTALSYRYRKGELIVVDRIHNLRTQAQYWIKHVFEYNGWGNAAGRSLLVANETRKDNQKLFKGMEFVGEEGRLLNTDEVDVKDLLEMGRVIIEYDALNTILKRHRSDLVTPFTPVTPAAEANLLTTP